MSRRDFLIGSVCSAISATAYSTKLDLLPSSTQQSLGNGCIISTKHSLSLSHQRTAVFVIGRCESAIPEITRLGLPIHTLAYFEGSVYGPNVEALFADAWNISHESVGKVDDVMRFVKRAVATHNRFVIIGNFSAPFASSLLSSIAAKARSIHHPVFAIGGLPAPGAYGSARTQWGWTCIRELRRIGCCVITVPEVTFDSERLAETSTTNQFASQSINEGSPFCRAVELAINEGNYNDVAFDDALLAATFSTGKVVSLGWGYCANGDAMRATKMALISRHEFAINELSRDATKLLVTSNSAEKLILLRTSTEFISDAVGKRTAIHFALGRSSGRIDKGVQATVFH